MNSEWETQPLGDVLEVLRNGVNCKQDKKGLGQKITRIETIAQSKFDLDKVGYSKLKESDKAKYKIEQGDILFSHINSVIHVGKTALYNSDEELYHGVNLLLMRPKEFLLPNYLEYYLKSLFISGYWRTVCKQSVNQASVNQQDISKVLINYPKSLPEQQRIVSLLDEAFASIAQAKSKAERNLVSARELFEAVSKEVFDTNGKGWEEKKLGDRDIIEIIDNDRGVHYPKKSDFHPEGHCLFMNTKNVRPDGFDFTSTMFITEMKDKSLGKGKLSRNDVVMTTRGTIGNLGVYNDKVPFEQVRTNSGMLIFRPNTKHILPEFLFEVLRSGTIKAQIKKHVSGAAQPQLPIKTLVNFSFHLPNSLAEQHAIIERLEALSAETKRLEEIYQSKLDALEELKRSVLARAFSGEL